MAGFCRTMREEQNSKNKEAMLDYLIALLDDSNDFSWAAAKASHAVLLYRMEQGEIIDYTQTDLVDRVRRAHAQRHVTHTSANSTQNFRKSKTTKSMPCNFYNQGSCNFSTTHKTKGVLYKHICSFCFSKGGKILHMLKLNVGVKTSIQKTSKSGRGSPFH